MNGFPASDAFRRVLGRVPRHDFVGRAGELDRVLAQATPEKIGRGLLLLMEPSVGVSELLRQTYDELFNQRSEVIPIYYAFTRSETTAVSAAIEFLNAFLQQYIAFRRNEPALCHAALTLQDLLELTPPADLDWVEQLVEAYKRQRFSNDDKALVRFCLGVPQRVPLNAGRPFVMLDGAQLAEQLNGTVVLGTEVLRVFGQANISFLLAGLRRQILQSAYNAKLDFETIDLMRLEQLSVAEARLLAEHVARRQQVATSEEARDLIVQQFGRSPFFITTFLQAAREKNVALGSYLDCERLYVDELLGGRIQRHFTELLEEITPGADTRMALIRLLWEAQAGDERAASFEALRRRLRVTDEALEEILQQLHIQEFLNWDGNSIELGGGPLAWKDFLKTRYRLNILNEPRALVVADTLADALKHAPHTMARHYKQSGRYELRELLTNFDCQRVPAVLLNNARFNQRFKGANEDEVHAAMTSETDLVPLPQVVNVASCLSFNNDFRQVCEENRCMVARGFEDGVYSDAREVVILSADIESKLAVDVDVAEIWCDRMDNLARTAGFRRQQIWLISNEGFSDAAANFLEGRRAFSSSRRQVELLFERLGTHISTVTAQPETEDEFLIVVPMGENNELVAANTVEQIARRLDFRPEALNQIKTAIVEACINASEHSFSPDRKIYQRFRVENDRLVVTISSRGIVPTHVGTNNNHFDTADTGEERRGWGLKLIRSLMDEVEFERVDEGTRLRMTKYVRNSSS